MVSAWNECGTEAASPGGGDILLEGLGFGVLEAEVLGDSAGEMAFDFGEGAVGIDDAPDCLDETQALLARKALAEELRELEEVDAHAALLLGQPEDLVQLVLRNVHLVPDVTRDAVPLLEQENFVRVRDLEQQGAGRHRHRIGARRLVLFRGTRQEEGTDRVDAHQRSLARRQVSGGVRVQVSGIGIPVSGFEDASGTNWHRTPETSTRTPSSC